MNFTFFEKKDGTKVYQAIERYIDPLTGKRKKATISFDKDTARCRNKARRELEEKIERLIDERLGKYDAHRIGTFGELRDKWLSEWTSTVRPDTVQREKPVLKRVAELIPDATLLERCTPILIKQTLDRYKIDYEASLSTMSHITEYGSRITSHSFRQVMTRVNAELREHCQEWYGFTWTKNCVPHSLRHIHISVLQSDPNVSLKEVQSRVGHENAETTAGYTHQLNNSQHKSVVSIEKFMKDVG